MSPLETAFWAAVLCTALILAEPLIEPWVYLTARGACFVGALYLAATYDFGGLETWE